MDLFQLEDNTLSCQVINQSKFVLFGLMNNNKNTASDKESSLPKGNESWVTIIMLILPLIYYSCATYTIKLVDEASQSGVSNIPFEVLDLDRDEVAENVVTDDVGEYTIKLSNIPDDSFFVSVSGNADFLNHRHTEVYQPEHIYIFHLGK